MTRWREQRVRRWDQVEVVWRLDNFRFDVPNGIFIILSKKIIELKYTLIYCFSIIFNDTLIETIAEDWKINRQTCDRMIILRTLSYSMRREWHIETNKKLCRENLNLRDMLVLRPTSFIGEVRKDRGDDDFMLDVRFWKSRNISIWQCFGNILK